MQKSDSGGGAIRYRYHQLDECFLLPEVVLQSRQNRARHGLQLMTEDWRMQRRAPQLKAQYP